ncbi:hypothetical protein V490_00261 [Pseudogymnoascus sp. VKM F-3557]|nr:hypothetical protein V490_00261 [Pseudogymnoascus sp. VKM F-3557]
MSTPTSLPYVTLDVFTSSRYAGNPLGVVRIPPGTSLTQAQKQTIAREFNYSETIFIHESEDQAATEHRIDIFMTDSELPFAGHPTIGAAHILSANQSSSSDSGTGRKIITKAGPIPYRFNAEQGMAFVEVPHDFHTHSHQLSAEEAIGAGVPASVAAKILGPSPVVSIVKELTFVMVELPSNEVLSTVSGSVDPAKLRGNLDHPWFTGNLLGTWYFVNNGRKEDRTVQISARMVTHLGTLEDPATGSAASAFSVYWAKRVLGESASDSSSVTTSFQIKQGVDMGRPSEIRTEVELEKGKGDVKKVVLGGSAVQVMKGEIVV